MRTRPDTAAKRRYAVYRLLRSQFLVIQPAAREAFPNTERITLGLVTDFGARAVRKFAERQAELLGLQLILIDFMED